MIDIEFGAFGDNGVLDFIKSDFDRQVDAKSLLVGSYTWVISTLICIHNEQTIWKPKNIRFEKLLAGKYLGEIVRCILVKLAREDLIFNGEPSSQLLTHDSFTTRFISSIEQLSNPKSILLDLVMNPLIYSQGQPLRGDWTDDQDSERAEPAVWCRGCEDRQAHLPPHLRQGGHPRLNL